jgi:hypothetical protein
VQHFCYLTVGELSYGAQEEHGALSTREVANGVREVLIEGFQNSLWGAQKAIVGGLVGEQGLGSLELRGERNLERTVEAPVAVSNRMDEVGQDPGAEAAALVITREVAPGLENRFLHSIVSVGLPAQKAPAEHQEFPLMRFQEIEESLRVWGLWVRHTNGYVR